MALARSFGAVVNGVSGQIIAVEVDHSQGLPTVGMVGLPDASVSEAKHRARTAMNNQKLTWPKGRITISLSPAEVRKHGAGLDLAIAMGVLGATRQITPESLSRTVFIGELGLDGSIRPVPGALSSAIAASQAGFERVVVPLGNSDQCSMVPNIQVVSFSTLAHVIEGLDRGAEPLKTVGEIVASSYSVPDLSDVLGQSHARWALEIAAAGGHNMLMVGAPGVGKTLLAERLPGILPPLTAEQSLEVTAIHSIAGDYLGRGSISIPPFQSPHHSSSMSAIVGSVHGQRVQPGAITKAHHGVLFLDEAPEFHRNALEVLRQPLESGRITLSRAHWSGILPAQFQLLMAANPCPCGNSSPETKSPCTCGSQARRTYEQRLSGPLRDRIDLNITIPHAHSTEHGENSESVAIRVREARDRAQFRFAGCSWQLNAHIPPAELRKEFHSSIGGQELLDRYHRESGGLRGAHRILRVAWSLADLAGRNRPERDDIATAIHLRERPGALAL